MIDCGIFYRMLRKRGLDFFTGVPDSLLKDVCAYIADNSAPGSHFITASEGGAVALAAGRYLATGRPALVYMQNSGQGNAINPLASLADPEVYGIPMLLLVGWRGEPGGKDEPQHVKQGKVTRELLDVMEIPHAVMPRDPSEVEKVLDSLCVAMRNESRPVALVVTEGTFCKCELSGGVDNGAAMTREEAICRIVDSSLPDDIFVSTTGKASRELYECREERRQGHERDFLTVGSMGHTSHIALGIALSKPGRQVFCIDGDGSVLMHMGSLAVNAAAAAANLKHIVLNNGSHDSVGGQPTAASGVSFPKIALACGYRRAATAVDADSLSSLLRQLREEEGPALLEILVRPGARGDLGRPKTTPGDNKKAFMEFLAR